MKAPRVEEIFKSDSSLVYKILYRYAYAHEIIPNIDNIIKEAICSLNGDFLVIKEGVFAHKSAKIAPSCEIVAPAIIDEGAEVRHCAYLRGNVLVGKRCVVGNSSEIKSSILFDCVNVPHYNYVGNSVIGYGAHLGAGAIISNLKSDKSNVKIDTGSCVFLDENEKTDTPPAKIDTKCRKFGALVGDRAEIGCGSVLNPGTVIMPYATVYPLSSVRGTVPESSIYKGKGNVVKKSFFNKE